MAKDFLFKERTQLELIANVASSKWSKKKKKPKKRENDPYGNRFIYALLLEDGKYYIGQTTNINKRFAKHKEGKGSKWTKLHQPIGIIETFHIGRTRLSEAAKQEDLLTIDYARRFGAENVRGGGFCRIENNSLHRHML